MAFRDILFVCTPFKIRADCVHLRKTQGVIQNPLKSENILYSCRIWVALSQWQTLRIEGIISSPY